MSTATIEAPQGNSVVTTTAEISTTTDENLNWVTNTKNAVVRAAKTGWGWFASAVNWIVDRAIEAYDWAEDKVVRGSKWLWEKTKNGGRRSKRWARTAWDWSTEHAVLGWNWAVDGAVWAWSYVSPALYWASTPVRVALGAIFGTAAVATFGPAVLFVGALGYLTYVLVTGRFWFGSRETNVDKMFKGNKLILSTDQNTALMNYFQELEGQKPGADTNAKRAQIAGAQYLVEQRLAGSTAKPGELFKAYKAIVQSNLDADQLKNFSFMSANTGIRTADARVRKLLTQTSVSAQPEVVLA